MEAKKLKNAGTVGVELDRLSSTQPSLSITITITISRSLLAATAMEGSNAPPDGALPFSDVTGLLPQLPAQKSNRHSWHAST